MLEHVERLSRFDIVAELGRGGMGVVYEAIDRSNGMRVALKTLQSLSGQGLYLFKREFRALREVHHPNLVRLGELLEEDGLWFFTMDLVEGLPLLEYMCSLLDDRGLAYESTARLREATTLAAMSEPPAVRDGHYFNEIRLRAIVPQIVDGLGAIHAAGKIHRDVKPNNILITSSGQVILLDFGLVVEREVSEQTTEVFIVGTPAYMAPEQASSEPLGPAADWYAVGAMLYEILTGKVPHDDVNPLQLLQNRRKRMPPSPANINARVPADLDQLCMKLLARDPANRPTQSEILRHLGLQIASKRAAAVQGVFVGRQEQLQDLHDALGKRDDRCARAVLVSGESGVGKSALVTQFIRQLDSSTVILRGRCREHESVPYNAIDSVIDELSKVLQRRWDTDAAGFIPRYAALVMQVFPVLSRVKAMGARLSPVPEVEDHLQRRHRVFSGLRDLIGRICDQCLVVIAIDDIQWADDDSLALLEAMLQPPGAPPLLLVATTRSDAVTRLWHRLPGEVTVIDLPRLSAEDARKLAAMASDRPLDDQALGGLLADAAGHPLFVLELAHHASKHSERQKLRLEDAIRRRVAALDEDAVRIVELTCVSQTPLPPSIVCTAADISVSRFTRAAAALLNARLLRTAGGQYVDSLEPYHDRVRQSVVTTLDRKALQQHHAALARTLLGTHLGRDVPEMVVHHLQSAGWILEAAAHAEAGGVRAMAALAFDRAAELYQQAYQLRGKDKVSYSFLSACASAHARAGRTNDAAELFAAAAKLAPSSERHICMRESASHYLLADNIVDGVKAAREALRAEGLTIPGSDIGALIYLLWLELLRWLFGLPERPEPDAAGDAKYAQSFELLFSLGRSYTLVDNMRGRLHLLMALRISRHVNETIWTQAMLTECCSMLGQGSRRYLDEVRVLLPKLIIVVRRLNNERLWQLYHLAGAMLEYFESNFGRATELCEKGERACMEADEIEWAELMILRLIHSLALLHEGKLGQLRNLIERYFREASRRGDAFISRALTFRIILPWAGTGELSAWHARCDSLRSESRGPFLTLIGFYRLAGRVSAALVEGASKQQTQELKAQLSQYRSSMVARGVGFILYECNALSAQLELAHWHNKSARRVVRIIKQLNRGDTGYAWVQAALIRAGLCHRQGDRSGACRSLRRAVMLAQDHGMQLTMHLASLRLAQLDPERYAQDGERGREWIIEQGATDIEALQKLQTPGFDD